MKAPFFRITKSSAYGLDKETALRRAIQHLRGGIAEAMTRDVDAREFARLEESPFAYWVSDEVRASIVTKEPLEPTHAEVRQGLATADDGRFLRLWFEVQPDRLAQTRIDTEQGMRWAGFAKGGTFAPFYSDVSLVLNWEGDGAEAKTFASGLYGGQHWTRILKNTQYCFRPGLTYPRRAESFNVRAMPAGCAFGDKGPSIFANDESALPTLLGILNSSMASYYSELRSPRADSFAGGMSKSFEVGSVQKLPVPRLDPAVGACASALFDLHRRAARYRETTHDFIAPLLSQAPESLRASWDAELTYQSDEHTKRIATFKADLDDRVFDLYGVSNEDRAAILTDLAQSGVAAPSRDGDDDDDVADGNDGDAGPEEEPAQASPQAAAEALLSYAIGCAFGRWDVRIGRDPARAPSLGGPFDPLPRCSPGMLVGEDGLPAHEAPKGYPISFPPDGVLVDDKDHPLDIGRRIHDVFVALFSSGADARLEEALSMAGASDGDLRAWLRTRFFERVHRPRYTMGGNPPRRAPIFWPIYAKTKTKKAGFGVWLYYPRLSHESLFTVARIFKERRESEVVALNRLADGTGQEKGRAAREARDARELSDELIRALDEVEKEAQRVAQLRAVPEFDDGVILNCAVLHQLVGWADAKAAWAKFQNGAFDWSNLAKKLRPEQSEGFRARERALAEAANSKKKKPKTPKTKREPGA